MFYFFLYHGYLDVQSIRLIPGVRC